MPTIKIPRRDVSRETIVAASTPTELPAQWSGVLAMEGTLTGDGRLIETNALTWRELPLPLMWAPENLGEHRGAQVVGWIDSLSRRNDGAIVGEGRFDLDSEIGREAARHVMTGLTDGVSVDLDSVSFEVRVASELMPEDELAMLFGDGEMPEQETDEEGRVVVARIGAEDEVMVMTEARVSGATMVAIPAFAEARLEARQGNAPESDTETDTETDEAIVASAAPVRPPLDWFRNPGLSEPTPFTVREDGRVFGHLAQWGTCHTAFPGQCVTPPSSPSGYANFLLGSLVTAEGDEIPVGKITLDTGHPDVKLGTVAALAHYDNTGLAVADVMAGEDEHGIWVAGALRSNLSEEQVRSLRASPLSGDWRPSGTGHELVAALAVNSPGFPIPRPRALVASGRVQAITAAGMLPPPPVSEPAPSLSSDDVRYLKKLADDARRREPLPETDPAVLRLRARALAIRVQSV